MKAKRTRLILEQLDTALMAYSALKSAPAPLRGWIKAIRTALGMSGKQFAARLGVSQPRVGILERDEVSGVVSLNTMRKAAEALDCVFVYAIVPRASLAESVGKAAAALARERLRGVSHTMMLEGQQLSRPEMDKVSEAAVDELVNAMPKQLWDKRR